MNILWISNITFPEVNFFLGQKPLPFGSWLYNSAELLSSQPGIKLSVAFPSIDYPNNKFISGKRINYYKFPKYNKITKNNKKKLIYSFEKIIMNVKPDLIQFNILSLLSEYKTIAPFWPEPKLPPPLSLINRLVIV